VKFPRDIPNAPERISSLCSFHYRSSVAVRDTDLEDARPSFVLVIDAFRCPHTRSHARPEYRLPRDIAPHARAYRSHGTATQFRVFPFFPFLAPFSPRGWLSLRTAGTESCRDPARKWTNGVGWSQGPRVTWALTSERYESGLVWSRNYFPSRDSSSNEPIERPRTKGKGERGGIENQLNSRRRESNLISKNARVNRQHILRRSRSSLHSSRFR